MYSPGHYGMMYISSDINPDLSAYETEWGGGVFGTFELAFPDYPFGWDKIDQQECFCSGKALSQYDWQWKAMPAGGRPA